MRLLWRLLPIIMLIALAVGSAGCAKEPPPPPPPTTPPPPPPPTPEEISAKIIADAGLNAPLPAEGESISAEDADKMRKVLANARSGHSKTPEGQRALQLVGTHLDQRTRALENAKAWEHVLAAIQAFEALNPGSPKWQTSKENATIELKKPKVTLVGFLQDHAILQFYMPISKETFKEKMQVGEELHGLKFLEIIGNNQGVRMEYGATGQSFDVLSKSAQKAEK